jgi:alkaline phosphatase
VARKIGDDTSPANVIAQVQTWWGLDITTDDAEAILDYQANAGVGLDYALGHVISERYTIIGWTTHGHNGEDVPLWGYGPGKPTGLLDNTRLAHRAARAMGFELSAADQLLFASIRDYFSGAQMDMSDPANPVCVAGNLRFPAGKDLAIIESMDLEMSLPGLAVHVPANDTCYVPLVGIALIDAFNTSASKVAATDGVVRERLERLAEEIGIDPDLAIGSLIR